MKNIQCIYLKNNKCVNYQVVKASEKEHPDCVLCKENNNTKSITMCKYQKNITLVGGIWTIPE